MGLKLPPEEPEELWPWQLKVPKPRGLWVGKWLKEQKYWPDENTKVYSDRWYYRIRKKGLPFQLKAIENLSVQTLKQAQEYALLVMQGLQNLQVEAVRVALQGMGVKTEAKVITMGDWEDAFTKVALARGISYRRPISDMRMVIAVGRGMRGPMDPKVSKVMYAQLGEKIRQLPVTVVNEELKFEYWRIMQGEAHRPNISTDNPPACNGSINSNLLNARVMGGMKSRVFELAALKLPWDEMNGFFTGLLPERQRDWGADVPRYEQMLAMIEAANKMAKHGTPEEQEVALVNEVLRTTGMRSGEMVNARASWLNQRQDKRWYVGLWSRPDEGWSCKTDTRGNLPLSDNLAQRLLARCAAAEAQGIKNPFLIYPINPGPEKITKNWEDAQRARLVRRKHNAWLKTFIGEAENDQGNHRLRKYLATMLYEQHGLKVALAYLRHANEGVAFKSYIKQREEVLPAVHPEDLEAWGRPEVQEAAASAL